MLNVHYFAEKYCCIEFWCLDFNIFAVGALLKEGVDTFLRYFDRTFVLLFILLDFARFCWTSKFQPFR